MKKIFKYPIQITDEQVVMMPAGAKILTVQNQKEIPCIWAIVDPAASLEKVKIRVHGTGHDIKDSERLEYIGTFQILCGGLVFHVFKIR